MDYALIDESTRDSENSEQFLTFMLAGEEYGVDILRVQEIKGWERVTEIPNTPEYVLGVINLRGNVIPVIDLRLRFDIKAADYTKTTVVIFVRVLREEREMTIGFVADSVSDVYIVERDNINPAPDFGQQVDTSCVSGIVSLEEKLIIVLDVDQIGKSVVSKEELCP